MWHFKLLIPRIDVTEELMEWVKWLNTSRTFFIELKDGWVHVESQDVLNREAVESVFERAPEFVKKLMEERVNYSCRYLDSMYTHDATLMHHANTTLQVSDTYIVPTNWKPHYRKPFENNHVYYQRLQKLFPPQAMLMAIEDHALKIDTEGYKDLSICYEDIMMDVEHYILSIFVREQRRFVADINRILRNCKKIRTLHSTNTTIIKNLNI